MAMQTNHPVVINVEAPSSSSSSHGDAKTVKINDPSSSSDPSSESRDDRHLNKNTEPSSSASKQNLEQPHDETMLVLGAMAANARHGGPTEEMILAFCEQHHGVTDREALRTHIHAMAEAGTISLSPGGSGRYALGSYQHDLNSEIVRLMKKSIIETKLTKIFCKILCILLVLSTVAAFIVIIWCYESD